MNPPIVGAHKENVEIEQYGDDDIIDDHSCMGRFAAFVIELNATKNFAARVEKAKIIDPNNLKGGGSGTFSFRRDAKIQVN